MTPTAEAAALLRSITAALLASGFDPNGISGSEVRKACGEMDALSGIAISSGSVGQPLLACFNAAREAGATLEGLGRVRAAAVAFLPDSEIAKAIVAGAVTLSLSQEAQVLKATKFVSRDEVERQTARFGTSCDQAEMEAADAGEAEVYRALVTTRAAVVRDLSIRARPLPRMVNYQVPVSLPSVVLANRLYGDASRADDLTMENGVVHPLFMPPIGRALGA